MDSDNNNCIGCDGRGWVDSKYFGPSLCPICKGNGLRKKDENKVVATPMRQSAPVLNGHKSPRSWAFCEAINHDGTNLIRYCNSTECWRKEIGPLKETGYTGWENKSAVDSFKNKGWRIDFGDPDNKVKGMRVVRPR
ncbi:MAG: hypothetical protein AAC990_05000 [Dehalococcoides mccartyi]|uniref:hypothetical protein n=1 Tax=Dehalococcoides mccartyi TaxID=61435 RepID=UPI0030F55F88